MNSSTIQDAVLQAIDIISKQNIANAGYDKTIQATIIDCVDATIGKYKVQYQDSIFYAYTTNTNTTYTKKSNVYILIPNGDMSKEKTIIGSVNRIGTNYISVLETDELYNIQGKNLIKNGDVGWELCSYRTATKILYNKNNTVQQNQILIDNEAAPIYFKESDLLVIKATIRNALDIQQKFQGNYGILVQIDFKNKTTGEQITRNYIFDVNNFTGNPYNYLNAIQQSLSFQIDGQNFLRVNTVALFVKDFPLQDDSISKVNDIFISNIQLFGAKAFSTDQLNTSALVLYTPEGYLFTSEDSETDSRKIIADLRLKGKAVDLEDQKVDFYWFQQDTSITTRSPFYTTVGGQGWKCLNNYNIVTQANISAGILNPVYDFISGTSEYSITKSQVVSQQLNLKCVAIYDNLTLSQQISFINSDSEYILEIESDSGTAFHNDLGHPTLTCTCLKEGKQVDPASLTFIWSMINSAGMYDTLQSSFFTIDRNKISLDIATIVNFAIFKCSVFKEGFYIGTISINLSNRDINAEQSYFLLINNGSKVFKYSTSGISPTSNRWQHPMKIDALTFTLYDANGNEVDTSFIANASITWKMPFRNTLLKSAQENGQESVEGFSGQEYIKFNNLTSLSYDIADEYDQSATNNQIELKVIYNGNTLIAKTNFTFLKQGDSGTNGTDFICRIVPNSRTKQNIPQYPTIYYYKNKGYSFNWDNLGQVDGFWFNVQLWHNGDLIYPIAGRTDSSQGKTVTIIGWEVLQNRYSNSISDVSNIIVNENGSFTFDYSLFNSTPYSNCRPANIVKVTLVYDGMIYTAYKPIIVCVLENSSKDQGYKVDLKEGTGFNNVLYSAAGLKPTFNNKNPFTVQVHYKANRTDTEWEQISLNPNYNFTYEWTLAGSVWNRTSDYKWYEQVEDNTLTSSTKKWLAYYRSDVLTIKNQKRIKPVDNYDGECVNTALTCYIKQGSTPIGWIHMPIHMHLNQYENSAINGWDGNSVNLGGQNGGTILAPQIGAGIKDNHNRFTGIFMGTAKDPEQNLSENVSSGNRSFANGNYDVGLFGYSEGRRSIFLDAKTGKAVFGTRGAGQITIDPSNNTAIIRSGNYVRSFNGYDGSGMEINLSEPYIRFGSGNFSVDKNGIVTMKGADVEGYASFKSLSAPGQTIINGSNITTGSINASLVTTGSFNASLIKTGEMSASRIKGGTLTLGGYNNTNGKLYIIDNLGKNVLGSWTNEGIKIYDTSGLGVRDELKNILSGYADILSLDMSKEIDYGEAYQAVQDYYGEQIEIYNQMSLEDRNAYLNQHGVDYLEEQTDFVNHILSILDKYHDAATSITNPVFMVNTKGQLVCGNATLTTKPVTTGYRLVAAEIDYSETDEQIIDIATDEAGGTQVKESVSTLVPVVKVGENSQDYFWLTVEKKYVHFFKNKSTIQGSIEPTSNNFIIYGNKSLELQASDKIEINSQDTERYSKIILNQDQPSLFEPAKNQSFLYKDTIGYTAELVTGQGLDGKGLYFKLVKSETNNAVYLRIYYEQNKSYSMLIGGPSQIVENLDNASDIYNYLFNQG